MTKNDKIKLVNALIRENPDYTIRDYVEIHNEIDAIKPRPAYKDAIPAPVEDKKNAMIAIERDRYTVVFKDNNISVYNG
jgi:hypothetical protein